MEVSVAEMKTIEQNADARGLSYTAMMENAGAAAAQLLVQKGPKPLKTAAVFCGSGNNGGDGFVLARLVRERGTDAALILVQGEPKTADAILNRERAAERNIPVWKLEELTGEQLAFIRTADAVVDAVYGTGFHGELRPAGKQAARLMNEAQGFCLALDLPSGVEADTGRAAEGAVKAELTVTFHAAKACHRLNPEQCGRVEIASIGIEALPE